MRFKFFPGSELSPPNLLGGIIDLDRPQHLIANLFVGEDQQVRIRPVNELPEGQLRELENFPYAIPFDQYKRVPMDDIMHYTSRRRAMC